MTFEFDESLRSPAVIVVQQWRRRLFVTSFGMILLGVLAIIMPVVSSYAVNFLIGAVLTLGGLLTMVLALYFRGTRVFFWMSIASIFPFCAGLFLLLFPASGLVTLTFLVAAIFLLMGISQSLSALYMRGNRASGWVFLSGLISIGLFVLIFVLLPEASTVLLGILLGVDLIVGGFALVLLAAAMPR